MKKYLLLSMLFMLTIICNGSQLLAFESHPSNVSASKLNPVAGVVVYEGRYDYFIVYTENGYCIVEAYGCCLSEDDIIIGELNSFGFKDVYIKNRERTIRVYVEDYWMSEQKAIDWMVDHDKVK